MPRKLVLADMNDGPIPMDQCYRDFSVLLVVSAGGWYTCSVVKVDDDYVLSDKNHREITDVTHWILLGK